MADGTTEEAAPVYVAMLTPPVDVPVVLFHEPET
jgi:hypothetical protein